MNRLQSEQVAHDLKQTLREVTNKKVSNFTMGKVYDLEGGGIGRDVSANLDGKKAAFVAVEINGQLGIYDARLSPHAKAVHEILGRSETAAGKHSTKASHAETPTGAKQASWPNRQSSAQTASMSARVRRR